MMKVTKMAIWIHELLTQLYTWVGVDGGGDDDGSDETATENWNLTWMLADDAG